MPNYVLTAGVWDTRTPVRGVLGARRLRAIASSYALSGVDANLNPNHRTMTATARSYALSGIAATLTYSGAASYTFANEPGAYTLINNQPWDTAPQYTGPVLSQGWSARADGDPGDDFKLTIQNDATAPYSPSNVLRAEFHVGDPGGSGPFTMRRDFAGGEQFKNLFFGFVMMHSAGFSNQGSPAVNTGTKVFWPETSNGATTTYMTFDGANMNFGVAQQGGPVREMYGTLSSSQVLALRGTWVKYEMLLKANTANGTGNGELHVWINGTKTTQVTDVDWVMGASRKWTAMKYNPTYGGGVGPVPFTQYEYMDHLRLSGSDT